MEPSINRSRPFRRTLTVKKKMYSIDTTTYPSETHSKRGCLISGYSGEDEPDSPEAVRSRTETAVEEDPVVKSKFNYGDLKSPSDSYLSGDATSDDDQECEISASNDTSFYESLVSPEQVTKTLTIALATVLNLREVPNDNSNKELAEYVLKVFGSDETTIKKQWRKASQQEKPQQILVVNVKSGSNLVAKDSNGKSDPYVRMGIIDPSAQGESIVKSKDLMDWHKAGGIMITGEIKETAVQHTTLSPKWNQSLELAMGGGEREMLVVEVWDSDEKLSVPSKVGKFKHFLNDLRKTDDFMGRAFFSLWSINGRIQDKVLELCSHSGRSKYGTLTVDMSIEQVKKNIPLAVGMLEHVELTHAVVNHEARSGSNYRKKWNGELGPLAERLLDKHAEFSGLTDAHKAAVRLSILMKYHRLFAVKMASFHSLIKKISFLEEEVSAILESSEKQPVPKWVFALLKDFTELAADIEEILKNHLTVYNIKESRDVDKIKHRCQILFLLYSFGPFVDQLPPEKRNLKKLLEKCIQVAVPNWFIVLCAGLMPDKNTPDMQLSAFKALIGHILNNCQRVKVQLNPVFQRANVDYFTQFYTTVDKLMFVEAISKLEIRESPDDVTTYEVYRTMQEIRKLRQYIPAERHEELKIIQFHKWFQGKVNHWISLATSKCKAQIKKAIELDKVVQVTEDVQFSSSAVDGTGFLLLLMKLNNELDWPAKAEAFTLKVSIVRSVCDCAVFYVGEVFNSLSRQDMFDEQGTFRATEKLSIVLNNMQHIKAVIVNHLKDHSQLCTSCDNLTEEESKVQEHSQAVMETLVASCGEDIDTKIAEVICQIIQQMSPKMITLIEEILDSKAARLSDETIDPVMSYLASNLQTLGNHLLTPIFQLILSDMWCVSIDSLISFLASDQSRKGPDHIQYYRKLNALLESFKDFFSAEGDGLTQDQLETEKYKDLEYHLELLGLNSNKLILTFYSELADQQTAMVNIGKAKLGQLLLTVSFDKSSDMVELSVLQGVSLPGLDNSGLSDPFVELCLLPPATFGQVQVKKYKTNVKKKTINPAFNEDFLIPATREGLRTKGSVLLLTVYDHDILRSNDLCGVCVVRCEDIPHVDHGTSVFDNSSGVPKNYVLPLIKITEPSIALKELTTRAQSGDQEATNFFKNNKNILSEVNLDDFSISYRHKPTSRFFSKVRSQFHSKS